MTSLGGEWWSPKEVEELLKAACGEKHVDWADVSPRVSQISGNLGNPEACRKFFARVVARDFRRAGEWQLPSAADSEQSAAASSQQPADSNQQAAPCRGRTRPTLSPGAGVNAIDTGVFALCDIAARTNAIAPLLQLSPEGVRIKKMELAIENGAAATIGRTAVFGCNMKELKHIADPLFLEVHRDPANRLPALDT